jgi:hypothetical protein
MARRLPVPGVQAEALSLVELSATDAVRRIRREHDYSRVLQAEAKEARALLRANRDDLREIVRRLRSKTAAAVTALSETRQFEEPPPPVFAPRAPVIHVRSPLLAPGTRDCPDCRTADGLQLQNIAHHISANIPLLYICTTCGVLLTIPPPPLEFPDRS